MFNFDIHVTASFLFCYFQDHCGQDRIFTKNIFVHTLSIVTAHVPNLWPSRAYSNLDGLNLVIIAIAVYDYLDFEGLHVAKPFHSSYCHLQPSVNLTSRWPRVSS